MPLPLLRFAALILCSLALPASAIYKCTGADGKISFQDTPCAGKGETIEVKPAAGPARAAPPPAAEPAPAAEAPQSAPPAKTVRKENIYGPRWQRRTYLENRGLPDARDALDNHLRKCTEQQARLGEKKKRATNNLAGATWEDSISGEMQAAAALCDTKARDLQNELNALQREYRELRDQ